MKLRILILIAIALGGSFVLAQQPDGAKEPKGMETGFYELKLKVPNSADPPPGIIIYLRRNGNKLELIDPSTKETYDADIFETKIGQTRVGEPPSTKSAEFNLRKSISGQSPEQIEFVSPRSKGLYARAKLNGESLQVIVSALPSVWACGNHDNPSHTAQSETEMQDKTRQFGCSLWHKLKNSDMQ